MVKSAVLDEIGVTCQGDKQEVSSSRQLAIEASRVPTTPLIGYQPAANTRTF